MSIAHPAVTPVPSFFSRLLAHPAARVVLGLIVTMLPITLTMMLAGILVPKPLRVVWPMLLAAAFSVMAYRWFVTRIEQRQPTELSLRGAARETGMGVALGAALGLTVAGILAAAGAFVITGTSDSFGFLLKSLPEQIMVACFEEIMFRAVVFRIVEQRWGTRAALLASMLLFGLAHLSNDNVSVMAIVMTCIASLVFCACYMKTRRLWLPIGAHFAWNSTYDGLFAVPMSGHTARGWLQVSMSGPEWLTGGGYGVEASVVTLIVWGAVAILMLRQRPGHVLAH
ncbi:MULTISPECIES: CPBP family intramembrane glutamic endopeptidase [unclassified Duganella]|uniref:CPBP family intramembrane glutamic endopeptidase n=1 Tax=unclassified Duganella TaxID=2636909 RepID=UPI0008827A77|nr:MULTISPECIES: type II CAAX endopeptidase family protein [unclassified Duganella]SDG29498.1 hypothetical protein SAMN05216320_103540 [Duganella sp. OV458]SDK71119.1 hypothetical protein SAMN05428973_1165 [Duganella sp. OV510]